MRDDREPQLELTLSIGEDLLAALADRIAVRLPQPAQPRSESPWLNTEGACAYLGLTRDQLYKLTAAKAIPVRKKRHGQGLRFHRSELDAWLEAEYPATGWTPKVELWSTSNS